MNHTLLYLAGALLCISTTVCHAAENGDKTVKAALELAESGPTSNAIVQLEFAGKTYPYHPANFEVLFQLGCLYMETAQLEKADATFDLLLKRYGKYTDTNPRVDESVIARAKILAVQKTVDDGITALRSFLKKRRKSKARSQALYELAGLYCEKEDYENAKKCLQPIAKSEHSVYKEDAEQLLAKIAKVDKGSNAPSATVKNSNQ
jgi:tetratricopeptide (TPR) repeat protein